MNTRQHRWWRLLAVIFAFTLITAACGDSSGDSEGASDDASDDGGSDDGSGDDDGSDDDGSDDDGSDDDGSDDDGSDDDGGDEAAAGVISEECAIPVPSESVTIDLMGWEFPVTEEISKEFDDCASDNLEINVQLLDNTAAQDQINLDLATGEPTFEIIHATDSLVGTWADDLTDLTPFVEKYRDEFELDDIPQAMWDGSTVDGKILGVPLFSNTMHFFYNTEILDENGITPPDNYDDVIAACGVLKEAGFDDPFNMNLSANWAWEIEFSNILKTLGGSIVNDDNTAGWNNADGVAAAEKIVEISDACMSDAGRAFGIDDAEAALRAGELPMATIWASRAAQMDDPENSLVVDKIGFAPSIKTNADSVRNGPAFVDYYAIPAGGSVDAETIFLTIMGVIDVESQNAAAAHAAVARLSASNADAPRNGEASAISVAEGVGARTKSPALPVAQGVLGDALLEITASGVDPATALADAETSYIAEAEAAGLL